MLRNACFFIALFFTIPAVAQQLPLETYTPSNGLVDAKVSKMFQDSKGRMYFLTREGFSIFDGQRFENYGASENKNPEIFNDITEYKDGAVKVFSFDGNTYTIAHNTVTFDSSQNKLLLETNKVFDIGNDEKLIATNYFLLREKKGQLKKLTLKMPNPGYPGIENGLVYKQFFIFSSVQSNTQPKLYLYNYETEQIMDSLDIKGVSTIRSDNKNHFFYFSDKWKQLNIEALVNGKLQPEQPFFENIVPQKFGNYNIQFDNSNNLWLNNAEKGYCQINLQSNVVQYFYITQGILSGTNFVYQDLENNYWFVSSSSGVQKLQRSPLTKVNSIDNAPLNFVSNISFTETNDVFINSTGGLFLADKKISPNGLTNRNIYYWQNQYWNFTDYKTLTGSKGVQIHLEKLIDHYVPLDYQSAYPTIDPQGRLIIAGKTLIIINKDFSALAYKLPYFCDNIIAEGNDAYWCFLRSNIALRLILQNNSIKLTDSIAVSDLNPRYSIKWNSNTFLVATRLKGISIIHWVNNHFIFSGSIDKRNGLSNNFVNIILKKGNDRLLAGTGTGLDIITFTDKDTIVENFSARNNIFSSFNNLITLKDTAVLCQTLDGQLFKLENIDKLSSSFTPSAFLKNIKVNNENIDFLASSSFGYASNNFVFTVSAPSFLDNRNTRFKFTLSGKDRQWQQHTNSPDFPINNLLPGKYQLTVTVQYPGKFYPDQQILYTFIIRLPFWKQWWFISLLILLLTGTIFFIIRNYFKRQLDKQKNVLEKELAIEQERTRMSRELHDGLGSMLSGIKHSFSAMKNLLDLTEQQELRFHTNIDKLNESIVELRNISHSMASDSLLKYGLANSLNDYCRNISEPGVINISFTALDTELMLLTEEQSFHVFRIVQELLQNVIKHAQATQTIVQLSYNAKKLYITVEDDGSGFDIEKAKQKNGLGLKNIETRVKIIKGRIDFQTSKGTSVLIEIPCKEKSE